VDAFEFQQTDAIEAWLPLFLFSILFGVSMDYHDSDAGGMRQDPRHAEAVTYGLRTTGGIITGATIIMVAVFADFPGGRLTPLEEMGFGLAVAVFIRHDRSVDPGPVGDEAPRRSQLVPAQVASGGCRTLTPRVTSKHRSRWWCPKSSASAPPTTPDRTEHHPREGASVRPLLVDRVLARSVQDRVSRGR
jgi:hypothetical protein